MQILFILYHLLFLTQPHEVKAIVHDIHLSKSEIRHNTQKQSIEISVKIFIDDLELTLEQAGHTELNVLAQDEHPAVDSILSSYLLEHLQIATDNKLLTPQYLGKELSDDLIAVWCYLEISDVADFRRMDIQNLILLDLYDDQQNIVAFYKDRKNLRYEFLDHTKKQMTLNQ